MARVLVLSDSTCQGLPAPAHVRLVAVEGLTLGGLLSLLDSKPGLVQCPHYDVIFLHVGAHNLSHGLTVQTLVSLLDLAVFKIHSLSPCARVVVSSLLPWPSCDPHTLALISLTNKALAAHFGKRGYLRSNFKLVRGGKARPELFVDRGRQLNISGCECLWGSLANFLRYLKTK